MNVRRFFFGRGAPGQPPGPNIRSSWSKYDPTGDGVLNLDVVSRGGVQQRNPTFDESVRFGERDLPLVWISQWIFIAALFDPGNFTTRLWVPVMNASIFSFFG